MLPLTGYPDRMSATPGGRIAFKVSSTFEDPYHMDVVRIRHGDPNPAGPGMKLIDVPMASGTFPSRLQPVHLGSYARIDSHPPAGAIAGSLTVGATVWPTLPAKGPQTVLSTLDAVAGEGFSLDIGPDGTTLRIGLGDGRMETLAVGKRPRARCWYRIAASFDGTTGTLSVAQTPLSPQVMSDDTGTATLQVSGTPAITSDKPLLIAAEPGRVVSRHFNGKIERPFVASRVLASDETVAALAGGPVDGLVASWDFSQDISGQTVTDAGPYGLHGRLINMPTRAMKGSNWTGAEMCWRHAPEQYGAIHFHEDDLYDCGWETDFVIEIPADAKSGLYGARLRCGEAEDIIPFYVPVFGRT